MTKLQSHRPLAFASVMAMIVWFWMATSNVLLAQVTLTTLVAFDGNNGRSPESNILIQGSDGNFYGGTAEGGPNNSGTVFKMTPAGTLTTLHTFCSQENCSDGATPVGSLAEGTDGSFYGATQGGGSGRSCPVSGTCGTVFKISLAGRLSTLYSFCTLANCADGDNPDGGLLLGRNGSLYGTTRLGGMVGGGTVFEITPAGNLVTLHNFTGADGDEPLGELVQAANGNLYGETLFGSLGFGSIFEVSPGGRVTTIFNFDGTESSYPSGGLLLAANGDFYGVTSGGGGSNSGCPEGCGTIFRITPAGKLTTLHDFCTSHCEDGAGPNGALIQGSDGNVYGTTSGDEINNGTIFEITPQAKLTTLYTFCTSSCGDGAFPLAGLLQATDGAFYGTTSQGGSGDGGTVFNMANGLGPTVKLQPTSSKQGGVVGIFGQGFDSSSVAEFGGVPATSIKVSGATFLTATIPAGALTGPVSVTTDGTTLTSYQQFSVEPQLLSFNPPSGPVGTQVTITGTGFTQTVGVGFGNDVPAQFTVNSDAQITATVPSGAEAGPIRVLTKGGTAISAATFAVN